MFDAVGVDAQRDHAAVLGEVHPVDHQRHQVQPGQVRAQQLGQCGLGGLDEAPRHRGPRRRRRGGRHLLPDGFEPDRVAAGREAGEHPLERHPAHHLGAGERLVGRHRHLAGAIHRAHPRAPHGYPASAQAGRAGLVTMAYRAAVGVVAALRAADRSDVVLHQRLHDLQPSADRYSQQALVGRRGDLCERDLHVLVLVGRGALGPAGVVLPTLAHGGPFLGLRTRVPTPRQVSGGDRHLNFYGYRDNLA